MDGFDGDDFAQTPSEEVSSGFDDPAADFLAREQEELGDLGQELGLSNGAVSGEADYLAEANFAQSEAELRPNLSASPQLFLAHPKPKEEPETIRKWREDHAKNLRDKDERESVQMEELRNQAKKELSDWYKHYDDQLSKTKASNRENEKEFVAEVTDSTPGTEVSKLCDFSAKSTKHSKDMSRMRSIMLQLKQNPPVKNGS